MTPKPAQPDKVAKVGKYGWHVEKCCEKKGHSVWYVMHDVKVVEVCHTEESAIAAVDEKVGRAAPPPGLYDKAPRDEQRQYGQNRG